MSESAIRIFAADLGFLDTFDDHPIDSYQEAAASNGKCGFWCKNTGDLGQT